MLCMKYNFSAYYDYNPDYKILCIIKYIISKALRMFDQNSVTEVTLLTLGTNKKGNSCSMCKILICKILMLKACARTSVKVLMLPYVVPMHMFSCHMI